MAINKKLIHFDMTKQQFMSNANGLNNLTKPTNGIVGNIPYYSVVFLKDGYIWTHGHFINGTGIADSISSNATISWSKITDKPSTFTPSAHTQAYTTLTGSGTIANQAIVSSGTTNGWVLKTLGSRAFDSTSYLPLAGGTLTGNLAFSGDNSITWFRNTDYAKIHFKNTGDADADSYLGFETADNGNEYFRFGHNSGGYTEWMSIKSDGVRVKGTKVSLEGHTHSYLPLSGGTLTGNLILKGNTTDNMTYSGNIHPYIRFDNSDSSQNVSLVFTDYDSYRSPAGLKLVGNQGNEWFEASAIYQNGTKVSVEGHTHNYITSLGVKAAADLSSTYPDGLSTAGIRNNGYPFDYGGTITARATGGAFQIAGQWNAAVSSLTDPDHPTEMYIRGRRDSYDVWTTWTRVLTNRNWSSVITLPTKSSWNYDDRYLKLTGGAMTGSLVIGGGRDLILRAASSSTDSGDLLFQNGSGTEIGRIWLSGNVFNLRFSDSDTAKTIIHSGNIGTQSVAYATSAGNGYSKVSYTTPKLNGSWVKIGTIIKPGITYIWLTSSGTPSNNVIGVKHGYNAGWSKEIIVFSLGHTNYLAMKKVRAVCEDNGSALCIEIYVESSKATTGHDLHVFYNKENFNPVTSYTAGTTSTNAYSVDLHYNSVGTIYANIVGSATKATQDSDGNQINTTYLKKSGGTMTGTPYISMPGSAAAISDSQPFGITYGRIQGYSNIVIAADTDRSTSEYAIITSGYDVANATKANGLAIGYNTLTWKNNTVWHAGNLTKVSQLTNDSGYITQQKKLANYYDSRPTTANIQLGDGSLRHFMATSSMTEGKPTIGDSNIIHLSWDNNGGWDKQIAIADGDNCHIQFRGQSSGTWRNWITVLDSSNSSVSKNGETLTVKINGTSQSLTNTWRGIQNNLTSSSTTDSLSAYQGYLLANGSARDNTKLPLAGGTLSGTLSFSNNIGISGIMGGGNDGWGIVGTGDGDQGRLKIYVTDNATSDWLDFEFRDWEGTTYTPLSMTGNQIIFNYNPTVNGHSLIHTGNLPAYPTKSSWNYDDRYVASVSISGNHLRINKNGTNTDLTIPYANYARELDNVANINSGNTATYPWRRIATTGLRTNNWGDVEATILIRHWHDGGTSAILKISLRTNDLSSGGASSAHARWLVRTQDYSASNVKIALYSIQGKAYADVYLKAAQWQRMQIHVLANNGWTFKSSSEGDNSTNPVEAYTSIEAAATALYGVAYTSITDSYDVGIVSRAISDSDGNAINTTYLKRSGGTMSNTNVVTNLNADTVDSLHASNIARFYLSPMSSGAPADSAKSWFTGTMPSASGAIIYNVPGSEKTIIAGKSSGSFGHMLQLNYDDTYLRILRYYGGNWKSTDWEKVSAGYADSAGSAATLFTNNSGQSADACYDATSGLHFYRFNGTGNTIGGEDGFIIQWSWGTGSVGGQIYLDDNPSGIMGIRGCTGSSGTTPTGFTDWWRIYSDNYHPSADYATSAGSASSSTKLQTARTLWGQSFDGTANIGGTITFGAIAAGEERNLLYQPMAANDFFRIRCGGASNAGWAEIATADDGNEPIYVRQYTGAFANVARTLTLLDGSGNTRIPANLELGYNQSCVHWNHSNGVDGWCTQWSNRLQLCSTKGVAICVASNAAEEQSSGIFVNSSNNVGVGTSSPSYKLDVNGTLHANGATTLSNTLYVGNNATIAGTLGVFGTTTLNSGLTLKANAWISGEVFFSAADAFRLNYGSYGVIHRNDGGSYWILLTNKNNQNGGFNSLRPFHIDFSTGTVYMDNNAIIDNLAFTQCNISMGGRVNATWGYDLNTSDYYGLYFKSKNSSSTGILFNDDGNVGINTISPLYKLDVNGTLRVSDTITATSLAADYTDAWNDGTHKHPWYGYDHRYANTGVYSTTISDYFGMTLKTGSGNISITNGGNVGIGTFAPLRKLHVIGEAIFGESGYVASQGTGSNYSGTWVGQGFMELSAPDPYIDFHANKSTADFTSRLIQWSDKVRLLYVSSDASYNGYILTCEGNHHNPVILGIFDLKRSGPGSTIWTLDNICGPCVFTLANNWGSDVSYTSNTYWTIPTNLLRVEINGTLGANYTTKTTVKAAACIGTIMTRWINNHPVVANRSHKDVEGCSVECLCTDKAPGTNLYYNSNSPGKYIYITGARPWGYDDGDNGLAMDQFRRTGNLSYLRVRFVVYGWLE